MEMGKATNVNRLLLNAIKLCISHFEVAEITGKYVQRQLPWVASIAVAIYRTKQ